MTNLRCTGKLLKRFGVEGPPDPPPGDNTLGDWYANILFLRGAHVLLCVNERSRLPLVTSARELRQFPRRFPREVREVLLAIGVPRAAADEEASLMEELTFGPTRSRSVLGTINEFGNVLKLSWEPREERTFFDWSLALSEMLCSPWATEHRERWPPSSWIPDDASGSSRAEPSNVGRGRPAVPVFPPSTRRGRGVAEAVLGAPDPR